MRKFIKKNITRPLIKRARKRYIAKKSGGMKVGQIIRDVAYLKSVLNPEKKRYQFLSAGGFVGQLTGATGGGGYVQDITPLPPSGTSYGSRTGSSIKVHSMHCKLQFYQQANTTQPIRYKIYIVQPKGQVYSAATTAQTTMFSLNQFVLNGASPAIIDYDSDVNYDYIKQFKIVRMIKGIVQPAQLSSQVMIKTIQFGLRLRNNHVRFNQDTTTVAEGQFLMFIMCDSGNTSSTTASTLLNVPVSGVNTALRFNFDMNWFYYDN